MSRDNSEKLKRFNISRGLSKQSGKKKSCLAISKNPLQVLSSMHFMG